MPNVQVTSCLALDDLWDRSECGYTKAPTSTDVSSVAASTLLNNLYLPQSISGPLFFSCTRHLYNEIKILKNNYLDCTCPKIWDIGSIFFFFCGTGFWTQGLHLESLCQPFFVMGFFKIGSHKLFAWAGFKSWSSWSLPPQ
jgi:hypothetical protein